MGYWGGGKLCHQSRERIDFFEIEIAEITTILHSFKFQTNKEVFRFPVDENSISMEKLTDLGDDNVNRQEIDRNVRSSSQSQIRACEPPINQASNADSKVPV
jgi:hypothetical protein